MGMGKVRQRGVVYGLCTYSNFQFHKTFKYDSSIFSLSFAVDKLSCQLHLTQMICYIAPGFIFSCSCKKCISLFTVVKNVLVYSMMTV